MPAAAPGGAHRRAWDDGPGATTGSPDDRGRGRVVVGRFGQPGQPTASYAGCRVRCKPLAHARAGRCTERQGFPLARAGQMNSRLELEVRGYPRDAVAGLWPCGLSPWRVSIAARRPIPCPSRGQLRSPLARLWLARPWSPPTRCAHQHCISC